MKTMTQTVTRTAVTLTLLFCLAAVSAQAQTTLKASATRPGTPPFLFVSAFTDVVNQHAGDIKIQLNATGVATKHYVEATQGTVDIFYSSPLMHEWMTDGTRVFKNIEHGPDIAKKASVLFNFKLATYHVVTRADSGIRSIADFKGKTIFLGPPAGAATVIAAGIVKGASGLDGDKDFTVRKLPWGAGIDAFRNRQVAAMIQPGAIPSASIQQIALTTKIRFLGIPKDRLDSADARKLFASAGRTQDVIKPGTYGKNQVNTEDVITVGSWGGIGIRSSVPDAVAYRMTKVFWENIEEVYKKAAAFRSAIKRENVFNQVASPVHPGAKRYFEEIGMAIPKDL